MTNTALRDHGLCKLEYGFRGVAHYNHLDAAVVVKMSVRRGGGQLMMVMLHASQATGELALAH